MLGALIVASPAEVRVGVWGCGCGSVFVRGGNVALPAEVVFDMTYLHIPDKHTYLNTYIHIPEYIHISYIHIPEYIHAHT